MASISDGKLAEAIGLSARPIFGEDALEELLDGIGAARIVLVGEATHGTHEFYDLRAALTRKLVAQRGFSAVAIEGDWPDALRVDRYVRGAGDDESPAEALAGFARFPTWMWRNADVVRFVVWLRAYNHRQPADRRAVAPGDGPGERSASR